MLGEKELTLLSEGGVIGFGDFAEQHKIGVLADTESLFGNFLDSAVIGNMGAVEADDH